MYLLQSVKQAGIIIILVTLTACAPNKAWRDPHSINDDGCTSVSTDSLKENCIIENIEDKDGNNLYSLGFLEFTDRGNLFDNQARDNLLGKIEEDAKENGALVILFAHGWNHNSSFTDENVQQFRETLRKISSIQGVTRGRHVYGIYIGWRGRVLPGRLNSALTFWDRKTIAQAVGKGGVSDILLRLELIKKKYQNSDNTLVITGHSFGAAALLSGLNEILLQRILASKYKNNGDTDKPNEIDYFADGVVLVNPAIEAGQIFQTYENAMELNLDEENRRSLITIITSEDDKATRFLFPIGQTLDTIFTKQEELERKYPPYKISEFDLDTTTIGHYKPFHTGNFIDLETIKENEGLSDFFLGKKDTEAGTGDNNVNKDKVNLDQLCSDRKKRIDLFGINSLLRKNGIDHSPFFHRTAIAPAIHYMRDPSSGELILDSDIIEERSAVPSDRAIFGLFDSSRSSSRDSSGGTLSDSEIISDFNAGYVDCCNHPELCALSKNNDNFICNKNIPLSFIYTNKVLIKNHNDVFNDNFVAFLLSGVTGTVLSEQTYCNNKQPSYSLSIQELVTKCTDNKDKFNFSNCYSYFLEKLKSASSDNQLKSHKYRVCSLPVNSIPCSWPEVTYQYREYSFPLTPPRTATTPADQQ